MLGYFDADFYELGFNACLMHMKRPQLLHVIQHELAHYLTFINYGHSVQSHGSEFRELCHRMGWGEEVYKATTCLEKEETSLDAHESAVLRKVQKLMALTTSNNQYEAELAMIKSQQLLLKHNLESPGELDGGEKIVLKRILKNKRENAKMRSIALILETFFVNVIFCRAGNFMYLEILGDAVNIEIAEYVAHVLQDELDKLWLYAKKSANLRGTIAKNSFFLGLAKGYCNKIRFLKREYNTAETHALMVIEKKLMDAKAMVYKRLTSSKSHANYCPTSSALGEKMGRQLHIKPALSPKKSDEKLSLVIL